MLVNENIVFWDLETAFNTVALFSLRGNEGVINFHNLMSERYLISGAWKSLGGTTKSVSVADFKTRFKKDEHDDYGVVKALHDMLSKATVLVHHNGDRFDIPMFNARAILHGLPPLPHIPTIDTLKVARSKFRFNSNKLDYLAQILGCGSKKSTSPGLWMRAYKGDVDAINEMVEYNKQDVDILECVYLKLRPYMNNHPNMAHFVDESAPVCPNCGSSCLIRHGNRLTQAGMYARFVCKECGKYSRSSTLHKKGVTLRDG